MSEGINLTDIPIRLADSLNVNVFIGGLICSLLLMMILVLPIVIIVRSKMASWIPEVAIILSVMGICVGIGWLPVWFVVIMGLMCAYVIADLMKRRREG